MALSAKHTILKTEHEITGKIDIQHLPWREDQPKCVLDHILVIVTIRRISVGSDVTSTLDLMDQPTLQF